MAGKKPNILFIHTDSMDGRVMGCMGHPAMASVTPNIDRLAAEGVMFRNAYSNNPICCPSRASMMSGLHTHHCEAWNNYKGLSESDPTYMDQLRNAGYRSIVLGKTDYLSGHHTVRARVSAWTRSARIMKPNYRTNPPLVQESQSDRPHGGDWHKVDAAMEWLTTQAGGADPFFLHVGLNLPHPPFTTSRYYLDKIDASRVSIPRPDEYDHPSLEYQRVVKNWQCGFSEETVRLVRRVYFAMIAEVDAMVGEILEALDESGLADSTYVIFSSDHGELALEHRQYYKMSLYEPSVRVPLIVRGPGVRKGAAEDIPVSLLDIYPTLMDMAEWPVPPGLDGCSIMPELHGAPTRHPGWIISESFETTCDTGFFMIREGDWKYLVYAGWPPHLFNLKDDPDEVHDLASVRPEVVSRLDAQLRKIVDYEAVDRKVKAYDRASFRQWREERLAAGDYHAQMSRVFSGWDRLTDQDIRPWTEADEKLILDWLARG